MAHGLTQARTTLHVPIAGVALFLCLAAFPQRAHANASVFINTGISDCQYGFCRSASMFDLLVGKSSSLTLNGDTINGAIGLGTGGTITTSGTDTIQGPVDFSDSFTPTSGSCSGPTGCSAPSGSSFGTGTTVTGGTAYNPTLVSNAYKQFTDIDTYWKTLGATVTGTSPPTTGNWNIEGATTSVAHTYVYSLTSYTASGNVTIGCGSTLNTACNSSDLIVILVSGAINISGHNFTFAAASGLTDDQLLFIDESSSSTALTLNSGNGVNNNRTIRGDFFLDNGGGYTIGQSGKNITIDGRVFASNNSQPLTWNAGDTEAAEPTVPEPGTWALMIGGIAALAYFRRRAAAQKDSTLP